jgi:hypothetical protein
MAISSNGVAGLKTGVCTSTTRPSGPYEGQMIYETDTDMVAIWNGTAWRYISATTPTNGTVLQVVSSSTSTEVSTTSTSFVTTGLSATITPKSTSSKILVIANLGVENLTSANGSAFTLFRGTVAGTNLGGSAGFCYVFCAGGRLLTSVNMTDLDSPSTISAQTYTAGMYASTGTTAYAQRFSTESTMTLMEIAG